MVTTYLKICSPLSLEIWIEKEPVLLLNGKAVKGDSYPKQILRKTAIDHAYNATHQARSGKTCGFLYRQRNPWINRLNGGL